MEMIKLLTSIVFALLVVPAAYGLSVKCPDGWVGFSDSLNCYQFVENRQTYEDAKLYCESKSAHLSIIKSKNERDHLALKMGELSGASATWWLGFSFHSDSNSWKWDDKKDIDESITPWAENHPFPSWYCGVLNLAGKLESADCQRSTAFICEQPLGAPVLCEKGWEHHGKSCYRHHHEEAMNFEDARDVCTNMGSDLVIVNYNTENQYLYGLTQSRGVDIWLGIRENGIAKKYVWVDGTEDGGEGVAHHWEANEPAYDNGTMAGFMSSVANGKWSSKLIVERLAFVCEKPIKDFCQFDTIGHGDSCYNFDLMASMTHDWITAEQECTSMGMHLATIEDAEENDWINTYLRDVDLPDATSSLGVWIGYLETDIHSRIFTRISDSKQTSDPSVFTNFDPTATYDEQDYDALYLRICQDFETECNATWRSSKHSPASKLSMCEFKKGSYLNVSDLMKPKTTCPDGWGDHFGGNCYLAGDEELTWAQAEAFCKENNSAAHLVYIFTSYENDYVRSMASELGENVWIGLSDRFTEGQWKWQDGSSASYLPWAPGEPNGGPSVNFAEIKSDGTWNDEDGKNVRRFICKVKGTTTGDPEFPETTTLPPNPNCGAGWVEDPASGLCYHFIEEPLTWQSARDECFLRAGFRQHGDLVSITSAQEQTFIHTYMIASGTSIQHWIGLNDLTEYHSYEWSDGSPISFINWREGEPSDYYHQCQLINSAGTWEDDGCSMTKPSICKKKGLNYVEPTPEPPKSVCPDGWIDALDRCYYISKQHDEFAANWTKAKSLCESLHSGATLATIRNQAEQDFFKSYLYSSHFIGGTDADEEGIWKWLDGSPWEYTNWGSDEPNNQTDHNCLEIDVNANWRAGLCNTNSNSYFFCTFDPVVCPKHWRFHDGRCWHTPDEKASWQSALDICHEGHGRASLASIHRPEDNAYATRNVKESNWIGLKRNCGEQDFAWSDGSTFDYDDAWAENEPDDPETQCCGALYSDGKWKSDNCDDSKDFTCNLKPTHFFSCPSGWEKYGNHCYLINNALLTWAEARDSCIKRDANLVSIHSQEEQEFLKSFFHEQLGQKCSLGWISDDKYQKCYFVSQEDKSWRYADEACKYIYSNLIEIRSEAFNKHFQSLGIELRSFWAGASDLEEESVWKWNSNGDKMTYSNWYMYEPNGGEYESCLEVLADVSWATKYSWNDNECNETLLPYICERAQETPSTSSLGSFWIGLSDLQTPLTFSWSDASSVDYTAWSTLMPNHHIDDLQFCNFMYDYENYRWVHSICSAVKKSVCKKRQEVSDIPPVVYGCSEGQIEYEGSCYSLSYRRVSVVSAQAECVKNGGNLVTINDQYEQAKITSMIADSFEIFHSGLRYSNKTSSFEWISGEAVSFTYWAAGQPDLNFDDEGSGKCVEVLDKRHDLGYWFVTKCSKMNGFICEYPRTGFTTPPPPTTTTPPPEAKCLDYSWVRHKDHCYKDFQYATNKLTFNKARAYCQALAGDLVTIQDEEENSFLDSQFYAKVVWIGLQEAGDMSGYEWVDGSPLSYTQWSANYPDSQGHKDNCVVTVAYEGWINYNCDHVLGFICEMEAGIEPPTTLPPPTDGPDVPCHEGVEDGWIQRPGDEDYCYKIVASDKSWFEAEEACEAEEGRLASIHSAAENSFISLKLQSASIIEGWIGLDGLNPEDSFGWVDGSPLEFTHWAPGEPSDFQDLESCGTVYADGNYFAMWNDCNCGITRRGYACKKPKSGGWTTPTPTQPPVGHCPDGHGEHNGYCYIIQGILQDERKTWKDALQACKAMGRGYNLASIHSHGANAFVGTMIYEATDESFENPPDLFWIGLHATYYRSTYRWSDESHSDYFLWARNQPSISYSDSCTGLYGKIQDDEMSYWDDESCDYQYPYICKVKASTQHPHPPAPKMCSDEHSEFHSFNGECYLYVDSAMPWDEAEEECKAKSSHLVSILDIGSQLYMMNFIQNSETAWIGLSNKKTHHSYAWIDGWNLDFSHWASGYPAETEEDACVYYNKTDGSWYPNACSSHVPFICKYTDIPAPTPSPHGECPEGFVDYGDSEYCYWLSQDITFTTWGAGEEACMYRGSHLASIHSDGQNSAVHKAAKKAKVDLWLGLIVTQTGDIQWSDSSAVGDFLNWGEEQPNEGSTACGLMEWTSGKWDDVICGTLRTASYICKKKREPTTTTEGPTGETTESTSSHHPHESTTSNHHESTSHTTHHPHESTTSHHHQSTHEATTHTTTTTTKKTTTTKEIIRPDPSSASTGLSGGAIAGIVIMVLVAVSLSVVFAALWRTREEKMRKLLGLGRVELNESRRQREPTGFENIAYDASASGNN